MHRLGWMLLFSIFALSPWVMAEVSVEKLMAVPTFSGVKISPDGKYLAFRVIVDGKHALRFVDRESFKVVGGFALAVADEVGSFDFANNTRIVGSVLTVPPGQEAPAFCGELFGVDVDGSRARLLYGYRSGEQQVGSLIKKADPDYGWGHIEDLIPDDENHILISATPYSRSHGAASRAVLVDVYTGMETGTGVGTNDGLGNFYVDAEGTIRVKINQEGDDSIRVQTRPRGATDWIDIPKEMLGAEPTPLTITEDGDAFYLLDNIGGDRDGLFKLKLDGSAYTRVYVNDHVDVTSAVYSTDRRSIYALRVDDGLPSYLVFSKSSEATMFKQLMATFPGMFVSIESASRDENYWIVKTSSDVDEGTYYLYERDKNRLLELAASRDGIKEEELAKSKPIAFTSFDGTEINGYFTPAMGARAEPAPMVVLVHGGPQVRDLWEFDGELQVLATRGYSVLRINYRGSSGYGEAFQKAGYRQWGDAVQKDIIAGTRWAISEGLAREGKVCIAGASFGAYSAVQSATMAPDLFACVVANAGIYDLPLLYSRGDIEEIYFGEAYLEKVVGRDEAELERYSPVNHVDALKAPILIAHGKQDRRAPYKHALNLRKALDKQKKPYEWYTVRAATHGFYDIESRTEYMDRMLKFLRKYL